MPPWRQDETDSLEKEKSKHIFLLGTNFRPEFSRSEPLAIVSSLVTLGLLRTRIKSCGCRSNAMLVQPALVVIG